MSRANVETVRAAIVAVARRDVEAVTQLCTPDVDLRPPSHRLDGVTFLGHAGIRAWVDRTRESWSEMEVTVDEVAAAGDTVVVAVEFRLTGHESGVPVVQREFVVYTLRDGKIAVGIAYPTKHEALEAAGISTS